MIKRFLKLLVENAIIDGHRHAKSMRTVRRQQACACGCYSFTTKARYEVVTLKCDQCGAEYTT